MTLDQLSAAAPATLTAEMVEAINDDLANQTFRVPATLTQIGG
jgi:hypothetical protein